DAANYSLSQPVNSSATISPAALTVTATGQNQTYGFGGLGTTGFSESGSLVSGQSVTGVTLSTNDTTSTSGNYRAGTYDLTPSAATGSGGFNTTNYNISYGTDTGGLTVAQKALTVSATGQNRTYDGTTAATVTLADNRVAGDVFTDSYGAASFADKNAGSAKTVSVSGIGTSGTDAANYSYNSTAGTSAN